MMAQSRLDVKNNNKKKKENKKKKKEGSVFGLMNTCSDDCMHREGFYCSRLGKGVAVDCRDGGRTCWSRLHCNFFEKK